MIGATGIQPAGRSSASFPSGVLRKLWAKPIQQVPSPAAHAASIRFSAANAQSSMIQGPSTSARDQDEHGRAVKDLKIRFIEQ